MILNMLGKMSPLSSLVDALSRPPCLCLILIPFMCVTCVHPIHLNLHLLSSCAGWPKRVSSVARCLAIVDVLDCHGLDCRHSLDLSWGLSLPLRHLS